MIIIMKGIADYRESGAGSLSISGPPLPSTHHSQASSSSSSNLLLILLLIIVLCHQLTTHRHPLHHHCHHCHSLLTIHYRSSLQCIRPYWWFSVKIPPKSFVSLKSAAPSVRFMHFFALLLFTQNLTPKISHFLLISCISGSFFAFF